MVDELRFVVSGCDGTQNIVENVHRAVCPPDQTTTEERYNKERAIDGLIGGSGKAQFVAKPMDVEERGGELVEQEDWTIVIYEWALMIWSAKVDANVSIERTKPSTNMAQVAPACASILHPKNMQMAQAHVEIP